MKASPNINGVFSPAIQPADVKRSLPRHLRSIKSVRYF